MSENSNKPIRTTKGIIHFALMSRAMEEKGRDLTQEEEEIDERVKRAKESFDRFLEKLSGRK